MDKPNQYTLEGLKELIPILDLLKVSGFEGTHLDHRCNLAADCKVCNKTERAEAAINWLIELEDKWSHEGTF